MRRSTIISSLLLGATLAAGGFTLTPSFAGESSRSQTGDGRWLSIKEVLDKLEAAGYRNFEEVKREHGDYEVRATDRSDERIKVHVDPRTGDVMEQRSRDTRAKADDWLRGEASAFAECSERRCRDDRPQEKTLPGPTAR